jgi:tetratricopeptide (TPR) repeat protein
MPPAETTWSPRSPVFMGLCSVALAVPLAVLGGAAGPYDDPKAWALPLLVAATALGWLARALGPRQREGPPVNRGARVLRGVILASLGWWLVAMVTSIAPLQSLLGSFGRGMGLLVIGSAAVVFFLVQSECRTLRAVRSVVDVVLVGSVPVCLLALGQAAGWDPLPKAWDPAVASMTVRSTFGTHIFLGSYLVVLIPLTAARLEWAFRARHASGRWPAPTRAEWLYGLAGTAWVAGVVALIVLASHWSPAWWALVPWGIVGAAVWALRTDPVDGAADSVLAVSLLAGLLAGQVLVVVLSRGRGAFIGMLVGLSVTSFAFLIRHRAWKTLSAAALGLVGLMVFLVLLNWPGSPIASLGNVRILSRLSDIANVRHGSPGWVRLQVWRGISDGWSRQLRGEDVIPGLSPRVRSLIGYGPETQLLVLEPMTTPFLGVLPAQGEGWRARYVFDRSHNVLLDHLVTGGLVGAGLWVLLVGSLLAVGISRIRTSVAGGEMTIRLGALGAVLAHLAEGQVGIATPMPLALFWLAAALLTSGSWEGPAAAPNAAPRRMRPSKARRAAAVAIAALLAALVAWASTRWLLASVAYADGVRHGIAGQMSDAYRDFRRSVALAPWLPLPAEAAAYAALRLAGSETDPSRRLDLLGEADAALVEARRHAMSGAGSWALAGQVAFAEAQAGQRGKLVESLDAFAAAARLRPGDAKLLAQWGWAWLESGDPARARQTAERALSHDPRAWLAWAVLARSARALGDRAEAERAVGKARELASPEAGRLLDAISP